jgi:hypothetical protein
MSAKLMEIIKAAHKLVDLNRRQSNTRTMTRMDFKALCRYRDCLRMIEGLNIKPELSSDMVQIVINGRKGK